MPDVVYEIRDVTKRYKKSARPANDRIGFDVVSGEILGLLGPNGAGKSTLVKQMVAHLRPTEGTIRLFGMDVTASPLEVARLVGYYAQTPYALASLTVQEVISITARLRGLNAADARRHTAFWLERFELTEVAGQQMKRVSGGQQRLTGLAAAMVGEQPVLILDEPTNELDPRHRRLVWDTIRERNRDHGTTILLVTHNVLEAEQAVDRVAVIQDGRLVAIDTVGQLKKRVDPRLKIELSIQFGKRARAEMMLQTWGAVEAVTDNRLRILAQPGEAAPLLQWIATHMEELACEEYRVIPPTLEDVYLHFSQAAQGE